MREAVGDIIGANFDPSHLIWQGMDPVEAIRTLGDAVYFVHGKDNITFHTIIYPSLLNAFLRT